MRTYVPASHDIQYTHRLRSSSYSMSLDLYIERMRSCRLTALISGGRCKPNDRVKQLMVSSQCAHSDEPKQCTRVQSVCCKRRVWHVHL